MKYFLFNFLLIGILFNQAFAISFKSLDLDNIKNPQLKEIAQKWESEFYIDDAGVYGKKVFELNRSGKWDKTIRQIAYISNPYLLDIDNYEISGHEIYTDIKNLIYAMAYLDIPNTERAVESLATKYSDLIEDLKSDDFIIYSGSTYGAFSAEFLEMTIVDIKNNEYITLYGGYSE